MNSILIEKDNECVKYRDFKVLKNKFYIYAYLDPRNNKKHIYEDLSLEFNSKPIYIGKGKNERIFDHLKNLENNYNFNKIFSSTLKKIKHFELNDLLKVIQYFEDEQEAFEYEKRIIEKIGRKITSLNYPLLNIAEGGIGVISSSVPESVRKKLYGSPGEKNPAYRKDLDVQIDLIIDDYVNNHLTLSDLSKKYKADTRMIKKRLLDNNIEVSTKNQYLKSSYNMTINNPTKKGVFKWD